MERLTFRNENGLGILRDPAHTRVIQTINRLEDYEDYGMSPEEFGEYVKHLIECNAERKRV